MLVPICLLLLATPLGCNPIADYVTSLNDGIDGIVTKRDPLENSIQHPSIPTTKETSITKRETPSTTESGGTGSTTYIPPPKLDVTPELIEESLAIQPQNSATVASIIPYFRDAVISIHIQLDGPVANTLVVNASTSLPCASIGLKPDTSIILVPKAVKNGVSQQTIADCLCIAINMYESNVITYWIQTDEGSIYSLQGSNKIQDIDQMNTTVGTSISLIASSSGPIRRDLITPLNLIDLRRRQVFSVTCGKPCPLYHMTSISGTENTCGCMFKDAAEEMNLFKRGIIEPDAYTATMTADTCASISCSNNGGKAAIFNPFTLT